MHRESTRALSLVLALVVLAACKEAPVAQTRSATVPVVPVYRGLDCGRAADTAAVTWLGDKQALEQVMNRMRRHSLGSEPAPDVDFSRYALVLIELGQRPTAGWQLSLSTQRMIKDQGDGVIIFSVDRPIGDYAAQVVTSPCMMVAVPRGDYKAIRAQSNDNAIRVSTPVR